MIVEIKFYGIVVGVMLVIIIGGRFVRWFILVLMRILLVFVLIR